MDEKTRAEIEAEWERLSSGQEQTIALLKQNGFVPDESEWLTVKRYAQKYGMTVEGGAAWIESGVIPANCVQFLDVAGGIHVVKELGDGAKG